MNKTEIIKEFLLALDKKVSSNEKEIDKHITDILESTKEKDSLLV